jgi:hypothetical protein
MTDMMNLHGFQRPDQPPADERAPDSRSPSRSHAALRADRPVVEISAAARASDRRRKALRELGHDPDPSVACPARSAAR